MYTTKTKGKVVTGKQYYAAGAETVVFLRLSCEAHGRESDHAWHQQQVPAGWDLVSSGGGLHNGTAHGQINCRGLVSLALTFQEGLQ